MTNLKPFLKVSRRFRSSHMAFSFPSAPVLRLKSLLQSWIDDGSGPDRIWLSSSLRSPTITSICPALPRLATNASTRHSVPILVVAITPSSLRTYENRTFVIAKLLIWSLTTSIPLSSLAFNSSICFLYAVPYRRRANAKTVDVFPVPFHQLHFIFDLWSLGEEREGLPGGPYSNKWGKRPASMNFSTTH